MTSQMRRPPLMPPAKAPAMSAMPLMIAHAAMM